MISNMNVALNKFYVKSLDLSICQKEYATIIYNIGLPDPVAIPD